MDVPTRKREPAPAPCRAQPRGQNQLPAPLGPQIQIRCNELPAQLQPRQLPELHHRQVSRADARQLRSLRQSGAQGSHIPHLRTGIAHVMFDLLPSAHRISDVSERRVRRCVIPEISERLLCVVTRPGIKGCVRLNPSHPPKKD